MLTLSGADMRTSVEACHAVWVRGIFPRGVAYCVRSGREAVFTSALTASMVVYLHAPGKLAAGFVGTASGFEPLHIIPDLAHGKIDVCILVVANIHSADGMTLLARSITAGQSTRLTWCRNSPRVDTIRL